MDELLLTPEERDEARIAQVRDTHCFNENEQEDYLLQAQLAKAQTHYTKLMEQEYERGRKDGRERIISEVERYKRKPIQFDSLHPFLRTGDIYMTSEMWQALKGEK